MVVDVLVTDQLNFFIVFYETYGQPERRLCPLVIPYVAPGPGIQIFLIGGPFSVISSAHGMGPILSSRAEELLHTETIFPSVRSCLLRETDQSEQR